MNTEAELLTPDLEEQSSGEGATLAKPLRDAKRLTSSVALTLALTSVRSLFVFHILGPTLMGAWRYCTYGGVVGFGASRAATPAPSSRCRAARSIASATSKRKNAVIWPEIAPVTPPCYLVP